MLCYVALIGQYDPAPCRFIFWPRSRRSMLGPLRSPVLALHREAPRRRQSSPRPASRATHWPQVVGPPDAARRSVKRHQPSVSPKVRSTHGSCLTASARTNSPPGATDCRCYPSFAEDRRWRAIRWRQSRCRRHRFRIPAPVEDVQYQAARCAVADSYGTARPPERETVARHR